MKRTAPRFVVVVTPAAGPWRTPPILRLRATLKRLSRDYGLICTACRPQSEPAGAHRLTARAAAGRSRKSHQEGPSCMENGPTEPSAAIQTAAEGQDSGP